MPRVMAAEDAGAAGAAGASKSEIMVLRLDEKRADTGAFSAESVGAPAWAKAEGSIAARRGSVQTARIEIRIEGSLG